MKAYKHVVSFSGGKDSTAMLLMMLEKGIRVDRIVCIDTTKEFPQMYEHIKKVQRTIEPLKIEIVKINYDYWFGEHVKTRGKMKGTKGYGWPDFRNRWCTALKREAFKKLVYKTKDAVNIIEYHGIAYDEKERTKNNAGRIIKYPLVDWKITEKEALDYCYSKGFNWSGLYEDFERVSCWCCPLSRLKELRTLYNKYPDLWKRLKEMDKKSFRKFTPRYTVRELETRFDGDGL